jgi:hypothetical protein
LNKAHNLSASCHPDVHYNGNLVEETRGGRRVTRVVRVLWVDTNKIDHQRSVVFCVLERKWEQQLPTTCICHNEVELPGSYGCPTIREAEASS